MVALGLFALDPEPTSKGIFLATGITVIAAEIASIVATDTKNVNDAIVRTGAYDDGGEIITTPWSVTIHAANGTSQKVRTALPVFQIALWASTYP